MKRKIVILALLALIYLPAKSAHAAGTASGTTISNTTTVTYDIGTTTGLTATARTTVVVDNKVNATVTKNADVAVTPASTNQALVFVLANTGNATQRYALSVTNGAGIAMNNVRIYRDSGATPNAWDATDTLYVDAGTFGDVAADGTLNLLIVADTPGEATDGQTADYNLAATAVNAGTTTVTVQTAGENTAGVDVVFADMAGSAARDGARDGKHSASGRYTVGSITLTIGKTVLVYSDPSNGVINGTPPGYADCTVCPKTIRTATLRYTITVTVTGSGTAAGVVISDPLPANTTYNTGTLKLNGTAQSDAKDGDAGDVGGTTPGTVTVNLGDMTSTSTVQIIMFDVTIN